jgi:hypothetical protein
MKKPMAMKMDRDELIKVQQERRANALPTQEERNAARLQLRREELGDRALLRNYNPTVRVAR